MIMMSLNQNNLGNNDNSKSNFLNSDINEEDKFSAVN